MEIKTALILCAGYGRRLLPLTEKIPKPLLEINNNKLLDNAINFLLKLGIKKIKINTFHLGDQIEKFIKSSHYQAIIETINEVIIKLPKENYRDILQKFLLVYNDDDFEKYKIFDYRIKNQLILN